MRGCPRQRSGLTGLKGSESAFALGLLACQFTGTANGLGLLAGFLHGRFFEMLLELHFAKHAFPLKLFLQGAKSLFDIVVANADLHVVSPPS
jgi:hypothetical protein